MPSILTGDKAVQRYQSSDNWCNEAYRLKQLSNQLMNFEIKRRNPSLLKALGHAYVARRATAAVVEVERRYLSFGTHAEIEHDEDPWHRYSGTTRPSLRRPASYLPPTYQPDLLVTDRHVSRQPGTSLRFHYRLDRFLPAKYGRTPGRSNSLPFHHKDIVCKKPKKSSRTQRQCERAQQSSELYTLQQTPKTKEESLIVELLRRTLQSLARRRYEGQVISVEDDYSLEAQSPCGLALVGAVQKKMLPDNQWWRGEVMGITV